MTGKHSSSPAELHFPHPQGGIFVVQPAVEVVDMMDGSLLWPALTPGGNLN